MLGLLDRLAGALELRLLALELALRGVELPVGLLPALRLLLAGAALGRGILALASWAGAERRQARPDRSTPPAAPRSLRPRRIASAAPGVAGGGLEGLSRPGEDLGPDPVLAPDRIRGPGGGVDRLLLASRQPRAAFAIGRAASISSAPRSLAHFEQPADLVRLPGGDPVDEPGPAEGLRGGPDPVGRLGFPVGAKRLRRLLRAEVNSSSGPWKSRSRASSGTAFGGSIARSFAID